MEFWDEKIQRILQREILRRSVIDISRGEVRIGKDLYAFSRRYILSGRISMMLPNDVRELSDEQSEILANDKGKVLFAWQIADDQEPIEKVRAKVKNQINDEQPSTIFYGGGEMTAGNIQIMYLIFKSRANNDYAFHLKYFFKIDQQTIIGDCECQNEFWAMWLEVLKQAIQSMEANSISKEVINE